MYHDDKLGRGKVDRTFTLMKVNFDREETYNRMLEKSKRLVWGEFSEGDNYYLADGSGSCIEQSQFEVGTNSGKQEVLPWTLSNYLKVSNIKFPSRARIYCVWKRSDDGSEGMKCQMPSNSNSNC